MHIYSLSLLRMSRRRPVQVFELGITHLILLGLFLNSVDGVLCKGFSPEVISTKLGTSKGGTQLRVHVTGKGLDAVRPHYLRVNDWNPVKATHQSVGNGAIEDEFVMPPLQSTNKGVVRLSYSVDGVRYIKAGEFVYYDGEELATSALDPADTEGVWFLQNSIFPRTNTFELLSMSFTPTCRDEDGVVTEARYPIAYEYARQSNAKLSVHCPIESPRRITHISLNGQDYVAVEDPYVEHKRRVDYVRLGQTKNSTAENPPPPSPALNPPTANPTPPSPAGNPSPGSLMGTPVAASPPKSLPANTASDGSVQNSGRHLGSNMPVCTSTDTGMGLSILMMFPAPTTIGPINVTTDVAGSFTGVGGPMTYVVSVIVGYPGQYKLTSIVPSCAGITPPLSFNVSGPPSPQFSYVNSSFAPGGYAPGTSVSFNIQVVDGQGIIPSGFLGAGGRPFPFQVTLLQSAVLGGNNAVFPVPFTTTQLGNGNWQVTCTPTRFLPITGSVTLNGLPIVNSQFNFSLQALTATDAATKFRVLPNSSVPTGQQSLIIDTANSNYSLIHQITALVTDPSGVSIVSGTCDISRATVGCSFPMLLQKIGTYKLNVTIDSGTSITQVSQISVMPGMALGSMSSLRLEGMVSNNTQKTAGDTILARLNLLDAYGNAAATTFSYGAWNETVQVVLTCDQGLLLTMNLIPGLGSINASVQVTKAGYYVASAFIASTGNALQGSGAYGFYVNPNLGNTSYWTGNLMVGEMIAGVYTPVVLAIKDCYGNVIDGSSLRGVAPLSINMGTSNYSVQSVGRIFQVLPGLNQTVAKSGIIITANYGSIQLASYNATCLPGPLDINTSNVTTLANNFTVGFNGTLILNLYDSYGNLIAPSPNFGKFEGSVLIRDDTMGATSMILEDSINNANPYTFTFKAPIRAGHYYARIPVMNKLITTQDAIHVIPGNPIGANFDLSGPGRLQAQPSANFTMYITARDQYNNIWIGDGSKLVVNITARNITVPPSDLSITLDRFHGFSLTFKTPPTTGLCTINVRGFQGDFTSRTMTMQIIAGDLKSLGVEEVRQAVVNQPSSFYIVSRDGNGFCRDDPALAPDRFNIRLCQNTTCGRATINDMHTSGGRYQVTWSAPVIGDYKVDFWSSSGVSLPLTTLAVVASTPTTRVMYYPRCNGSPPTLATCPQFFKLIAGQIATFNLSSNNEPVDSSPTTIGIGGNIPVVTMIGGRIVSIVDFTDGTYIVTYQPISTIASININNGVPSIIPLIITPGITSSVKSDFRLGAPLLDKYEAGSILNGTFDANDAMGNQQDYTIYSPSNDVFKFIATNKDTGDITMGAINFLPINYGIFQATLSLIWAGAYNLEATLNDVPIALIGHDKRPLGTNCSFEVLPGPPEMTLMVYPPNSMQFTTRAGESGSIMVYSLRDAFGNVIPQSAVTCSAKVVDARGYDPPMLCSVTDDHVIFTYSNLTTSGSNYTFLYSIITLGGEVDLSNPLFIAPSDPWPSACKVSTTSPIMTTVGNKTILTIQCVDKFNNSCLGDHSGQFIVIVTKIGGNTIVPTAVASTIQSTSIVGQIVAYFYLRQSGNFSASVHFGNMNGALIGDDVTIVSLPADTSVNQSFAYLANIPQKITSNNIPTKVIAGSSNIMKIIGVDVFGNLQDKSKCLSSNVPIVTLSTDDVGFDGQGGSVAPLITNPSVTLNPLELGCVFNFNFTLTSVYKVGVSPLLLANYRLQIQWNIGSNPSPLDISGSPFVFQVDPGMLDIPSTIIDLQGRQAGVTGLITTFMLITHDRFGNAPFYNQTLNISAIVVLVGNTKITTNELFLKQSTLNKNTSFPHINDEILHNFNVFEDNDPMYEINPIITNNLDTTYSISFTVMQSGAYDVIIYMNGIILQPNPPNLATISSFLVLPGIPDITRLKPLGIEIGDGRLISVGTPLNFSINLCDNFGNPVNMSGKLDLLNNYMYGISSQSTISIQKAIGNSTLAIMSIPITSGSFSINNGVIMYSCIPTISGLLNIALSYNDSMTSKIVHSVLGPFHAPILPSSFVNTTFLKVYGPGIMASVVCEDKDTCYMNTLYIEIRDIYNNSIFPDKFLCSCFFLVGWNASLMAPYPGRPSFDNNCAISYKILPSNSTKIVNFNVSYTSGSIFALIPTLHQVPTVDSSGYAFTVPVIADTGDPEPTNCLAFGDLGGMIMAGRSGHIIVQLVDNNGLAIQNSISSNGDYVRLQIDSVNSNDPNFVPPLPPSISSTDNGDGTFSLEYDTFKTGNFIILIYVGFTDKPLGGKSDGYLLQVIASETVIEKTLVIMNTSQTTNRAGQDWVRIDVQAYDAYGNLQDYILASSDNFQANILQPDNTLAMIALNCTWQLSDNGLYNALWVLEFLPLQAFPESIYTFSIIWRNETTEIPIPSSPMIVPTIPGSPSPINMKITGSGTSIANVGTMENLMIRMFDTLNNPISEIQDIVDANITVTVAFEKSMNQTEANCNISSNPPGILCHYMVTIPGWYILSIYSNENILNTLEVQVGQGALSGMNCIAAGDGVGTTTIPLYPGLPTSFTILTFDHYNNSVVEDKVYFEVRGENQNQSGIIIPKFGYPTYVADNLYKVLYTPLKAGIYDLYVERASVHILGSPYHVEVQVGPVDIHCTLSEASLDPCPVSGVKNITLLSKDSFGNVRHIEQDVFHIFKTVDGFPNESASDIMIPIGNGQYSYGFNCINDTLIQITYDAMLVYEGKIGTIVGPADASQCTMSIETVAIRAGEVGKGTIISRDIGGHQLINGGLVFKIQYWTMSGNNDTMIVIDNADGTYSLKFQIMLSGIYFVIGQYNSITFYSQTLLVLPSLPSAPQTMVNVDLNGYTVNVEGSFTIQIFDEHQNNITDSGALDTTTLSMFYVSNDLPARTTLQLATNLLVDFDHESLIYTIFFTPILPGIVFINFKVGGEGVLNYGSPYQAIVTPLPPSPSNFDVWGPGIESGAITSETTYFYLRIRDVGGAVIQASPLDNFDARISPTSLVPSGVSFVYVGNGLMLFSYTAIQPSTKLTIALFYGGTRILSPVNLQVKDFPGSMDITQTVIVGPDNIQISTSVPLVYTVGSPETSLLFTIQPHDNNGFIITNPNFNDTMPVFIVMVSGMAPQTMQTDPNDWNFQFSIPYQTSAMTMFVAVQANNHGSLTDVKNSGFTILWMPGPSHPANTAIVQSSLNLGTAPCQIVAGQKVKNKVQAFDEYYNPQVYNNMLLDLFTATLNSYPSGDIMDNPTVGLNNGDLTYDLIQTVTIVGLYNITIYLNGESAIILPLTVVNARLDLTAVGLLTSLVDPLMVGQESFFEIMAVDKFQNPITDSGNMYAVFKSLATGANYSASVTASNDTMGKFRVNIIPCKAGRFDVIVGDGSARSVGPGITLATVKVLPGHVNFNLTNTSIPVEVYKAGSPGGFEIIALDSYSNPNYMLPQVIISQSDAPAYATLVVSPCNLAASIGEELISCDPDSPPYTAKVTFTPIIPGFVNISIFWDPENVITYDNMVVFPGTRPIALSATLSQNLGSIAVRFDMPTDAGYATFVGMYGTHLGWQRCNNTLDQSVMDKIGQGPNCNFADAWTMVIQLGYNATIMPADSGVGDNVTLLGNIYNQDDTSASMLGWVPLGITSFIPPPVAQLVGPIITGVCDNITLDASGSSGAAGRALQYNYYVRGTGDPNKLAAVASYLDSIPSQMLVNLNGGVLDPDQTYIFEVIVTNYLGMSDSATLTIRTVHAAVPQLSICNNQKLIEVMRWEMVELEAQARLSYGFTLQPDGVCALRPKNKRNFGRLRSPAPLSYEWSQIGTVTLDPDTTGWSARSLNIPGSLLQPNVIYAFQVKCWPTGSPQLSSTALVAVRAKQSPLTVMIVGGTRAANVSENLYLKASVYDPDDSVDATIEELHPYEYSWSCNQLDLRTMYEAIIYPDVVGNIKQTLMIPSMYLQDGSTYVFIVTVARAPYTDKTRTAASANATITTLSTTMNIIAKITNQPEVLAYGMSISRLLQVTCSAGLGVYKWFVQSGADLRMKAEMEVEMIDENTMKVKPGTLVPGTVYNFTCMATNLQGMTGSASVLVKTLADPSGGTVELSSLPAVQHIAGSTRYTMRAYGWTPGGDMIGSLKYEFRYVILNSNRQVAKEVVIRPISIVNKVTDVFVSPGMVIFRVYVINPGPVRFMPNDGPYGTLFEFEPIQVKKGQIHLLSAPSLLSNYYDFAKRGMYFKSLVSMDAYTSQAFPKLGSGCFSGGNKKAIKDMMNTISFNNPQYPIASQGSAIQSGSGPYIALLTASVYSRLISRPGNLNFNEFTTALHIYMEKLEKVAHYGIKVPTDIGTPFLTFLDAGDMFMKAVKMKCFKSGAQAQALMDQTSWIPIMLAEMIYHNNAFESPIVIDKSMFTVGSLGFKLPQNPYNPLGGPVYLFGQMGSFFATVAVNNGFGAEFGIAAACFNKWSPLSFDGRESLNHDKKMIRLLQVCDFDIVGLTASDLFTITITASFTNLKKMEIGYAYKVVQLDRDGIADFDILNNVIPTVTGVAFDFITTYSRICLVKMKMDKNYSPIGWAGLQEKFKPPKNKFKLAMKLEEDDTSTSTNYFGSNQLSYSLTDYQERIRGSPSFSGCNQFGYSLNFAFIMFLVVVFWNQC